ncbi:hypothetical protein H5410_046860 [Solanum commersonii]|uniref:Uncharacterized protein n=1 Tax=Solanum commersonii TaxID=4109 RepID=A0A9J5XFJ4_SOLCO|nr:hypothetical protein H5410_046860 [Solanum commersonii]
MLLLSLNLHLKQAFSPNVPDCQLWRKPNLVMKLDRRRTTEWIGDKELDRLKLQGLNDEELRENGDGEEQLAQVGDARLTPLSDQKAKIWESIN